MASGGHAMFEEDNEGPTGQLDDFGIKFAPCAGDIVDTYVVRATKADVQRIAVSFCWEGSPARASCLSSYGSMG